jgi:surface protein
MKRQTNLKNRFLLIVMMLMTMVVSANATPVPYVEYNPSNSTLMFKNGEKPTGNFVFDINTNGIPDWYPVRKLVSRVVFDPSFSQCRPVSCLGWFSGMENLSEIEGIGYLKTSNVTNMGNMFNDCSSLTSLDVSGFNTSNVENMSGMFYNCSNLTSLDVSGFNTSNVTDMYKMFYNCQTLTSLDVSGFKTSNVTNMGYMFYNCSNLTSLDVSGFNTSYVKDMSYMFMYCKVTSLDVSGFNTSYVTDMSYMFCGCRNLTSLDVSGFNTSNVKNMDDMFCGCRNLTTIYCDDTWTCENSNQMFTSCEKLVGAVSYDRYSTNVMWANPVNGYFTYANYDLKLLGVQVTGRNKKDLSVIDGVENGVSFDQFTNTLNLTDALIGAWNGDVIDGCISTIYNGSKKTLTINVSGDCKIVGMDYPALRNNSVDLVITGDGTLTLTGSQGIWSSLAAMHTITVKGNVTVNIEGKIYGVRGHSVSGNCFTTLAVKEDATLSVQGKTQDFLDIRALKVGEYIDIQGNYGFNSDAHTIVDLNNTPVKDVPVTIGIKQYGLELCGVQVNIKNSVLGISDGNKGLATYDNATKTLTLNHFYKYSPADCIIKNYGIDGLTIKAKGTSLLTSLGAGIVQQCNGLTITGDTLMMMVSGSGAPAIDMQQTDGTLSFSDIKSCVLSSISGNAIEHSSGNNVNMVVEGSTTNIAAGGKQGTIVGFSELTLKDGLAIINPNGAKYENGIVKDNEGNTVKDVVIGMLGDVNGDGSVTMADANLVVNYFLAADKDSINSFDKNKANINGDLDDAGKPSITMADANAIVNMFLKGK